MDNQYNAKFQAKESEFEAGFNSWFTISKDTLSGDVVGNLLNFN